MRPDGLVLAGGPGRRAGEPKAALVLAGRTLVERAVDLLLPRCGRVIVVSRAGVALPPLVVPVVLDRPGPDAPLVGLATGLAALDARDVIVLACDLPLAGPALDVLQQTPASTAVVAAEAGRAQPLCARYPRAPALQACDRRIARGALAAMGLVDELGAAVVEVPAGSLLNVNTAQDLARAEQVFLARG